MRILILTAFISLVALLQISPVALAAGNVLLPSTSSDPSTSSSTALPNLGMNPTAAAPAPSAADPTPAVGGKTDVPIVTMPYGPDVTSKLPPGSVATSVIHQPDYATVLNEVSKNSPYGLTISIGNRSIFGAQDVQDIVQKLGLTREQIPSNCVMTVRGVLQTDKGSYILDGNATPQVTVRYDGTITRYLMAAEALCTSDKLPPGSGMLTETDNRYAVTLKAISCPAPTRQTSQLTITYTGSDKSQCSYE